MPPLESFAPLLVAIGGVLVAVTGLVGGALAWRKWPSQQSRQKILDAESLLKTGSQLLEEMRLELNAAKQERDKWHEQHAECEKRMEEMLSQLKAAKARIEELEREVATLRREMNGGSVA